MLYSLQKLAFLLSLDTISFLHWLSLFYHSSGISLFSILYSLEMHYFLYGLFLSLSLFLPVLHIHQMPSLQFLLHFLVSLYAALPLFRAAGSFSSVPFDEPGMARPAVSGTDRLDIPELRVQSPGVPPFPGAVLPAQNHSVHRLCADRQSVVRRPAAHPQFRAVLAGRRDMRRGIPAAGRGMPEHNRIRQLCALADSGQPAGPARVDRVFQCGAPASRGATARTDARFPPARAAQLRGLPDTPVPDLAPETVLENRSALVCRTGPALAAAFGISRVPGVRKIIGL